MYANLFLFALFVIPTTHHWVDRGFLALRSLLENADPVANRYVRDVLEQMRTADSSEHTQIIEFQKRGMGEKGTWGLQPDGDLLLVCQFANKTFGIGGKPRQAVYISRHDLQIQREGDRWLGKDVNANLFIGGVENKVQLKPEMLVRLESLLTRAEGAITCAN